MVHSFKAAHFCEVPTTDGGRIFNAKSQRRQGAKSSFRPRDFDPLFRGIAHFWQILFSAPSASLRDSQARGIWLWFRPAALLSILLLCVTGCETKSSARLEAQRAYVAGQEQALAQSRPKPQIVTVKGRVRNPVIPWTEELTLARAIVAAQYTGFLDPKLIRLTHEGQTTDIKPSLLLQGQDMPVQPGDIIELVP